MIRIEISRPYTHLYTSLYDFHKKSVKKIQALKKKFVLLKESVKDDKRSDIKIHSKPPMCRVVTTYFITEKFLNLHKCKNSIRGDDDPGTEK